MNIFKIDLETIYSTLQVGEGDGGYEGHMNISGLVMLVLIVLALIVLNVVLRLKLRRLSRPEEQRDLSDGDRRRKEDAPS